jgi:hypothetical protein
MKPFTLAAFAAEKRVAALVSFNGTQIEDTDLRHLSHDPSKAAGSVRELVTRTLETRKPEFVAVSAPSRMAGERIRTFCGIVKEIAKSQGIPVMEVEDTTLMMAYGYPRLTRKEHLRRAGRTIWPVLNDSKATRAAVDAATTGLCVQTERLFSLSEAEA